MWKTQKLQGKRGKHFTIAFSNANPSKGTLVEVVEGDYKPLTKNKIVAFGILEELDFSSIK